MSGPDLFMKGMQRPGIDVSRETSDHLEPLVYTPVRWRKAVNFVGRATIEDVWTKHVLDPTHLPLIPAEAKTRTDLVSCGGFRSLPHPEEHRAAMRLEEWAAVMVSPTLRDARCARSSG
ncbi:MAG: hypothetical protein HYX38_27825 [Rhodospirillales bacterium]|nr:hypothetical protein [Rhodospirillales bacterium]